MTTEEKNEKAHSAMFKMLVECIYRNEKESDGYWRVGSADIASMVHVVLRLFEKKRQHFDAELENAYDEGYELARSVAIDELNDCEQRLAELEAKQKPVCVSASPMNFTIRSSTQEKQSVFVFSVKNKFIQVPIPDSLIGNPDLQELLLSVVAACKHELEGGDKG